MADSNTLILFLAMAEVTTSDSSMADSNTAAVIANNLAASTSDSSMADSNTEVGGQHNVLHSRLQIPLWPIVTLVFNQPTVLFKMDSDSSMADSNTPGVLLHWACGLEFRFLYGR